VNIYKLSMSFILLALIGLATIFFTVNTMNSLVENTQKLYTHPFTVSNAVADIQASIITMHRNMKDVALSDNQMELLRLVELVQDEENRVYKNFELIYQNYLGDKSDIDKSYQLFKDWKKIRNEVIVAMQQGQNQTAAQITKGKGAKHVENLYTQIKVLKNFAHNKADEFYNLSIKENGINEVITTIFFALVISAIIILYILSVLIRANKKSNRQLYLIDQNILTATFTTDKQLVDISNALCRVIDQKKSEILGKTFEFFFTTQEQFSRIENQIYSGKEYHGEVFMIIDENLVWFNIEVIPHLNSNYDVERFSLFFTNISDKKKIEEISITDALTGLNNRNYFEMIFPKEVKRAKRDNRSLSIMMFDIDFFKQYNDTYGHLEGDSVLKSVASVFKKHTNRSYDYAFRVGGEEFVLIAYHQTLMETEAFTQAIIDEIRGLKISHKKSEVCDVVSVSAGVVLFKPTHLLNTDEMYKRVDDLLYQSKNSGRNQLTAKEVE
jgi:diguanylate cyclase (GGDEF)-like protein